MQEKNIYNKEVLDNLFDKQINKTPEDVISFNTEGGEDTSLSSRNRLNRLLKNFIYTPQYKQKVHSSLLVILFIPFYKILILNAKKIF